MLDVEKFVGDLHQYLQQAIAPLAKRIADLEAERKAQPDALDIVKEMMRNDGFYQLLQMDVAEFVGAYLEDNPVRNGEPGPKGDKGEPGTGVAGAVINRAGDLVLTLSDGRTVDLGTVQGRDGRDGFKLEDFSAVYDGERGLTLTFQSGDVRRDCTLHLPVVIHRGFWSDGRQAKAGDAWSHAGSLWIARRDTAVTPAYDKREDWQLAARKGRDGEPGPPGQAQQPKSVKLNGS